MLGAQPVVVKRRVAAAARKIKHGADVELLDALPYVLTKGSQMLGFGRGLGLKEEGQIESGGPFSHYQNFGNSQRDI